MLQITGVKARPPYVEEQLFERERRWQMNHYPGFEFADTRADFNKLQADSIELCTSEFDAVEILASEACSSTYAALCKNRRNWFAAKLEQDVRSDTR